MYTNDLESQLANAVSIPHQKYILTNENERISPYRGPRVKHVV